ncbi:MAG: isoamylase, partial [Frankiales bacterium]|nr:isoamylase [Frankiales bacterium]
GTSLRGSGGVADIVWFTPGGTEMDDDDWDSGFAKSLGVFLNGKAIRSPDSRGEPVVDDSFLMLFNAHDQPVEFTAPSEEFGESWLIEVDTATPIDDEERTLKPGTVLAVEGRSLVVLRRLF